MAKKQVLGIFRTAENAALATERLEQAGFSGKDFQVLTGSPYPPGAFGEEEAKHRLYAFPFFGAIVGLSAALLITTGTQVSYPLVTGGKPVLGVPPMAIISYEGTMLGAILMTIFGVLFESRLPRMRMGLYDERITEGYIGIALDCPDDRLPAAELVFRQSGAEDVKKEA
ncbi:MAG: DUF3341 domain-containing protein [Chloroflexi bacterium]|nr:DUF3341 domain-containing protein [Chloroflexota bacterium]